MAERAAHLVGSLPGESALDAMTRVIERLGPMLRSLPDGETGDRRNWIINSIESLRSHPDLELVREGDWSDYDKVPRFRIRRGHQLSGATLDLGHVGAAAASLSVFEEAKSLGLSDDVVFQVGVPGDFDMAMFSLGPVGALRHKRPFTEATVADVRRVNLLAEGKAVFQIEIPAELVLLARMPRFLRPFIARMLAKQVAAIAAATDPGTRFGIHLCLGDMNHRALGRITDSRPLVLLTNALVKAWPADRPLEFVHAPFAAADDPPPADERFYAPLSGMVLPTSTRFIAGIAHEGQSLEDQLRIRGWIDRAVGRSVDISTSCGLGRRDEDAAMAALDRIKELCQN